MIVVHYTLNITILQKGTQHFSHINPLLRHICLYDGVTVPKSFYELLSFILNKIKFKLIILYNIIT